MNKRGFFQIITSLFLITVLLSLCLLLALFLDYSGIIQIHENFPDFIKNHTLGRQYLKKVRLLSLSDQDQIKELMAEQQHSFDSKLSELKMLEKQMEEKRIFLLALEEKFQQRRQEMASREIELQEKEQKLRSYEINIEQKEKSLKSSELDKLEYEEKLDRMSKIYEKMDAAGAAKILENLDPSLISDLFSRMKDKKAAEILNSMSPEKSSQILKRTGEKE